jgi:DNA processing protein
MGAANPNLKYWLGFSKTYSIGTVSLRRMLEHFGSIEQCWHASAGDLLRIEGVAPAIIERLQKEKKKLPPLEALEEKILSSDIRVLTLEDEVYPEKLKEIYDPPFVLYIKGSLERHNPERSLAVVGSRRSSSGIKATL